MSPQTARRLLQLSTTATPTDVDRSFRRRARALHPDRGGDTEAFRQLVHARAVLHGLDGDAGSSRAPLLVVHRGSWWTRLSRALLDVVERRRHPPPPRVR